MRIQSIVHPALELGTGDRIVPPSMDGILTFGLVAAVVTAAGIALIGLVVTVSGVMRRWRR
jgi:hypothetical protein